jgi:hypothetical protein
MGDFGRQFSYTSAGGISVVGSSESNETVEQFEVRVTPTVRRDIAIDLIRGLCVVSMTLAHIAPSGLLTKAVHLIQGVDGASGFVLLSGLVLGMIQPKRISTIGLHAAIRKLLGRALLIYVVQLILVTIFLIEGQFFDRDWLPSVSENGGPLMTAVRVLTLQLNPAWVDILSMYVILMVLAAAAVALLSHGKLLVVLSLSFAIYVGSQVAPQYFTFLGDGDGYAYFNWGAWQFIFLVALCIGWNWKTADISSLLRRPTVLIAFAALMVLLSAPLIAALLFDLSIPEYLAIFDKGPAHLGRVIMAFLAFGFLYGVLSYVPKITNSRVTSFLPTIGARSLDSFVILALATLFIRNDDPSPIAQGFATLLSFVLIGVMYLWARIRARHKLRKSHK